MTPSPPIGTVFRRRSRSAGPTPDSPDSSESPDSKSAATVKGDMPMMRHLVELRRRLIISMVAVGVGTAIGFALWNRVLAFTTGPYCRIEAARGLHQVAGGSACQLYITSPLELVTTRLTISGYLGLIIASPVLLWQLWRFITPGLRKHEKRYAIPFVMSSVLLFLAGGYMSWLVFPQALKFFFAVGGKHVLPLFNPGPYLKLIFILTLAFGLAFELPVVLVFLELAGVVTSKQLSSWRRPAIVINFIVAAVATPSQDPYSLFAMGVPLCLFYELAILIGRVLKK